MASASPLCETCRKINFEDLRCPTLAELEDAYKSERRTGKTFYTGKDGKKDEVTSKVRLGSFSRILRDSHHCSLCSYIVEMIEGQGATYNSSLQSLKSDDVYYVADPDMSYYGYITDAQEKGRSSRDGSYYVVIRLCVTAQPVENEHNTVAYFDSLMQPCNAGAGSVESKVFPFGTGKAGRNTMIFGGRKRPLQINMDWLRHWMEVCESKHDSSCGLTEDRAKQLDVKRIRFIDTKRQCVVTMEDVNLTNIKYAALSYVWGQAGTIMLLTTNKEELERDGAFSREKVPQTIVDAIEVTKLLGIEYIWVDALCILQNSNEDKGMQIGNMAVIYNAAFITIIAASGKNSSAGLPGLRPQTRSQEQKEIVIRPATDKDDGLSFLTALKTYPKFWTRYYQRNTEDLDLSTWMTRGWTMQERALSRRTLVFTEHQVIWSCNGAYYCEESCFEDPGIDHDLQLSSRPVRFDKFELGADALALPISSELAEDQRVTSVWKRYSMMVGNYGKRDFSFQGDVHDAFRAIVDALEQSKYDNFLWGMPCSRFDLALSWDNYQQISRQTELSTLPMTSHNIRVRFPSWSWIGWQGEVHFSVEDDRLESENPEVTCYVHQSNPLRLLPVQELHGNQVGEPVQYNASSPPWKPEDAQTEVSFASLASQVPGLTEAALAKHPDHHIIFFWASTAWLYADPPVQTSEKSLSHDEKGRTPRPSVFDAKGNKVGSACKMLSTSSHPTASDKPAKAQFVVVGRRAIPEIPEFPATLLALQIRWDEEEGVAFRENIADIEEEAWINAGPEWKLIALG